MLRQGVLPRPLPGVPKALSAADSDEEWFLRERLESAWRRTDVRGASTCAHPGCAGTRAPLSMTSSRVFIQTEALSHLQSALAALSLLCVLIQPLGAGKDQRKLGLVDVGDGLEKREGGIPLSVFDFFHVSWIASHPFGHVTETQTMLKPQRRDHHLETSLTRVESVH